MKILSKVNRHLDALVSTLCVNFNSTVFEINQNVLPHLRINQYMGQTVDINEATAAVEKEAQSDLLRFGGDYELYQYIQDVLNKEVFPIERSSWFAGDDEFDRNRLAKEYPLVDFNDNPKIQAGYSLTERDLNSNHTGSCNDFLYVHPDGSLVYRHRENEEELVLSQNVKVPAKSNSARFEYSDGKGTHEILFRATFSGLTRLQAVSRETLVKHQMFGPVDPAFALWFSYPADFNAALERSINSDDKDSSKLRAKITRALNKLGSMLTEPKTFCCDTGIDSMDLYCSPNQETHATWELETRSSWNSKKERSLTTEGLIEYIFANNVGLHTRLCLYLRLLVKLASLSDLEVDHETTLIQRALRAEACLDTDF